MENTEKRLTRKSTATDDMALQVRALTSTAWIGFIASCLALTALLAAQKDLLLLGEGIIAGFPHYGRVTFRPQHNGLDRNLFSPFSIASFLWFYSGFSRYVGSPNYISRVLI